ncbi:hypothetical protein FB33_1462, partial [Cutibacterium acnes]
MEFAMTRTGHLVGKRGCRSEDYPRKDMTPNLRKKTIAKTKKKK